MDTFNTPRFGIQRCQTARLWPYKQLGILILRRRRLLSPTPTPTATATATATPTPWVWMNRFDEQRALLLWSGVSLRRRRILASGLFDRYANFYLGAVFSRVLSGVQRVACMPIERSKEIVRLFKRELIVYQRALHDERIPTFREVASSFGYRLLMYAVRF